MRAFQIKRPDTAFALSTGKQKRPREHDDKHLKFVRSLPCATCLSRVGVEAAHVRYGALQYGKRETGASEKPHDKWTVPLCAADHRGPEGQHASGEKAWWDEKGIDPLALAAALFASSGDEEAGEVIVREFHARRRK